MASVDFKLIVDSDSNLGSTLTHGKFGMQSDDDFTLLFNYSGDNNKLLNYAVQNGGVWSLISVGHLIKTAVGTHLFSNSQLDLVLQEINTGKADLLNPTFTGVLDADEITAESIFVNPSSATTGIKCSSTVGLAIEGISSNFTAINGSNNSSIFPTIKATNSGSGNSLEVLGDTKMSGSDYTLKDSGVITNTDLVENITGLDLFSTYLVSSVLEGSDGEHTAIYTIVTLGADTIIEQSTATRGDYGTGSLYTQPYDNEPQSSNSVGNGGKIRFLFNSFGMAGSVNWSYTIKKLH